ncbi:hypothetical protein ACH4E5_39365 [Streptomyces afghaniensis]|uniref:hypothetical protein n=1 Tax=Streptomyces afghaniensis TaxID=66865 RepID=UPI0037BB5685
MTATLVTKNQLSARRFRRTTTSLVSVGVSRTTAAAAPALAALAWSLAAAAHADGVGTSHVRGHGRPTPRHDPALR